MSAFPFAITMLVLLTAFLLVPLNTGPLFLIKPRPTSVPDVETISLSDQHAINEMASSAPQTAPSDYDIDNLNLIQSLKRFDFWLLFFTFFAIIGSGITLVNNFAELVFSIASVDHSVVVRSSTLLFCGRAYCNPLLLPQYPRDQVPDFKAINTLVSLFSSFNALGRMLVGFLSDRVTARWGKASRVSLLSATAVLMTLVQLYAAFSIYVPMLYPGVVFLGLAYGATFCIVPTLTLDFFGFRSFGTTEFQLPLLSSDTGWS